MRSKLPPFLRYFLQLYLPLAVLFLAVSISFYYAVNKARYNTFKAHEILNVEQQEEIIRHDIQAIVSDLTALSEYFFIQDLLIKDNNSSRHHAEEAFLAFIRNKKIYDQLRFISADGMEMIRVDWNYGKPKIVPRQQLQDKSKRYYFLDTIKLSKGEIFASPFDLNIEHGEVEKPFKPMIRFATPIFNQDGKKSGMVILNFLGNHILEDLNRLDISSVGNILLLNRGGFYLRGTKAADEWGFMFPGKDHLNFPNSYPDAWQAMANQDHGQFVTTDGLFSFATIHPLFEGLKSSTGSAEAFAESSDNLSASDYVWKLVSYVPSDVQQEHQHPYLLTYIGANLLFLLIIGVGSWMAADAGYRRRKTEAELKSEREKFRTVADFTHDWEYWLSPDGRYLYTSPSSEEITGYDARAFQQDSGLFLKLVHPDDMQKMAEHLEIDYSEKDASHIDFRIITATGQEKWIAHVCQAVYDEDGRFIGRRASNRDISARKQAELELKALASHDILTGLPNRKLLYDRLAQILAQAKRGKHKFAILFVDLDEFKEINDRYGHDAGDIVLRETAQRMANMLRQGDTVARVGGDEFVVILLDIKFNAVVNVVAQKLIDAIGQSIQIEDQGEMVDKHIGASIGISIYPADGQDIDSLISAADKAMYMAKQAGRNQFARSSFVPT